MQLGSVGRFTLIKEIGAARDAASERQAFEDAAALHTRVEKAKGAVVGLPEMVGRIDRLAAVVMQPATSAHSTSARMGRAKERLMIELGLVAIAADRRKLR